MSEIYGPLSPRVEKSLNVCKANLQYQQFGQRFDDAVWDGKTACTHVCCQVLYRIWTGKHLTLNQVNQRAGMPYKARNAAGQPRGMNATELQTFFRSTGLPYEVRLDLTYDELLAATKRGPVLKATRHGSIPEWYGYVYLGQRADPVPNGYAMPKAKAGRTQINLASDKIRHATLLLGTRDKLDSETGAVRRRIEYRKDPNHRSPTRPERPPYDVIYTTQGAKEYRDYRDVLGNRLYAALPTRTLPL